MNRKAHMQAELWRIADSFNEKNNPGTRCFLETGVASVETSTVGWAFVCGDEVLVRVKGEVGAVPVDAVKIAKDGESVCPVCVGTGELKEAIQAWDCGGSPKDCSFCSSGIMNKAQMAAYSESAKPNENDVEELAQAWVEYLECQKVVDSSSFQDNYSEAAFARGRQKRAVDKARALLNSINQSAI